MRRRLMSEAFVGTDMVPDLAPPMRTAQPRNEVRSVKAY